FISLTCLQLDPSGRWVQTEIDWLHLQPFKATLDENVLKSYGKSPLDVRDQRIAIEATVAARRAQQSHAKSKFLKLKKVALFVIWYSSLVILLNHPSLFTALWIILNTGVVILGANLNRIARDANGGLMPVRQPRIRHFILTSPKH